MAVSQFLRPGNLIETIHGYLTPSVVRSASSIVGESESSTTNALHSTVPALLGGLLNSSSTQEGAEGLAGMVQEGGYGAAAENPASLFAGGSTTSSAMSAGQSMVGKIFGDKASAVSDHIASSSGVKPSSASALMSLLAPLTLGTVWKMAGPQGQNGSGIANLLRGQEKEITQAAPSGLSHILGFGGRPVSASAPAEVYEGQERATAPPRDAILEQERRATRVPSAHFESRPTSGPPRWLPLLLIGLIAVGLLAYFMARGRGTVRHVGAGSPVGLSRVSLPGGGNLSVPRGSMNYNLASYLATGNNAPRTFVFDNLNFETGSAQLTPDSNQTVSNLSTILKAYPNTHIQLAGHTDNTGTAQANQQLSLDRANAVKAMLVNGGIDGNRISTVGYGQDRPVGPNETEEGRARNRRTELTVNSQ